MANQITIIGPTGNECCKLPGIIFIQNINKKKCEKYITVEEFKTEYERAKEEITKYKDLIEELQQDDSNKLDETQIKETVKKFKSENYMSNDFLKEVINRIEIYSQNRIEITFNL